MTKGEEIIGKFNPDSNESVDKIKQKATELVNLIVALLADICDKESFLISCIATLRVPQDINNMLNSKIVICFINSSFS